MPFRLQLTVWWALTFALLLATANVAIYTAFRVYLRRDFDRKVRTVAAAELASSTDGPGIHLHPLPEDALADGEFADMFVQILSANGAVRLASPAIRDLPPLIAHDVLQPALDGRAPLVSVAMKGRPGRATVLRAQVRGERYVMVVGLFSDQIDAHLAQLAWVLGLVWVGGVVATAGLGYALASRALAPIVGISRRAARIARGEFAARLDPPVRSDEIGEMTQALNEVLDRLHGALEAHRRFAGDASHELRTPLAAIAGEIEVALRRPRSAQDYRQTLERLQTRLSSMTALCEDLMLLVHAQEGASGLELQEVPLLPQLQQSAARLAGAAAARDIQIEARHLPDLIAYADPRLLGRVLDNVLANAVFYNRHAGRIEISGRAAPASAGDTFDRVMLTIADTGTGIPADEWERVFERFYRVDRSRAPATGGSGLGLAICREVLVVLRGSISIATSSRAGTTLEIRLPGRVASSGVFCQSLVGGGAGSQRDAMSGSAADVSV